MYIISNDYNWTILTESVCVSTVTQVQLSWHSKVTLRHIHDGTIAYTKLKLVVDTMNLLEAPTKKLKLTDGTIANYNHWKMEENGMVQIINKEIAKVYNFITKRYKSSLKSQHWKSRRRIIIWNIQKKYQIN